MEKAEECEFRRCGGTGRHETKQRWRARLRVTGGGRTWQVCEGCAAFLTQKLRAEGFEVRRSLLGGPTGRRARQPGVAELRPVKKRTKGRQPSELDIAMEEQRARDADRVREILMMRRAQSKIRARRRFAQ
jgi:hypothetical protein